MTLMSWITTKLGRKPRRRDPHVVAALREADATKQEAIELRKNLETYLDAPNPFIALVQDIHNRKIQPAPRQQ